MKDIHIISLIKIGQKQHIMQLYNNGILYMNTVEWFRKYENNYVRGDKNEGTQWIGQPSIIKEIKIKIKNKEIVGKNKGLIKIGYERGNIFCTYAIKRKENQSIVKPNIDERNYAFGDTILLIYDLKTFIKRIEKEAKRRNYLLKYHPVEYIDSTKHHGNMGVFRKFKEYSYQNEFRILIQPGENKPLKLKIGNLNKCSCILTKDDLKKLKIDFTKNAP